MKKFILTSGLLFILHFGAFAQEEKFKGAYLFQFARIIDWPDPSGDLIIGVFGSSGVTQMLEQAAKTKKISNRTVRIKTISELSELSDCDIVFVNQGSTKFLPGIYENCIENGKLIVADGLGLTAKYAGISFIEKEGKILFELNKSVMAKCGLIAPTILQKLAVD